MSDELSAKICASHEACERNKRVAFRRAQTCLSCERGEAKHFIADGPAYILRCDECLVSMFGCAHAAPNVCPDCYDAITLGLHESIDYHKKRAEPRPCIRCNYTAQIIHLAEQSK